MFWQAVVKGLIVCVFIYKGTVFSYPGMSRSMCRGVLEMWFSPMFWYTQCTECYIVERVNGCVEIAWWKVRLTAQSKWSTVIHAVKVEHVFKGWSSLLQLYFLTGISPIGNSGCFPAEKASYDRLALPNLQCMLVDLLVFPYSTELWHGLQDLKCVHSC